MDVGQVAAEAFSSVAASREALVDMAGRAEVGEPLLHIERQVTSFSSKTCRKLIAKLIAFYEVLRGRVLWSSRRAASRCAKAESC